MLASCTAAILTGGSSGIGKSFIEHIGKLHPHVVICNLSRTDPHEENTGWPSELKLRHVRCDLTDPAQLEAGCGEVLGQLETLAPTGPVLLINNAGFGAYGRFAAGEPGRQLAMVDVNVRAVVHLTARLLPMLQLRGGAVVNIASTAAFQPTPFLATYGAAKAFVLHWSLALGEELRDSRVRVLAVCPGPTRTRFFARAGWQTEQPPGGGLMSSEAVVRQTFAALERGRALVVPGWRNRALAVVGGSCPKSWAARISGWILARTRLPKESPR